MERGYCGDRYLLLYGNVLSIITYQQILNTKYRTLPTVYLVQVTSSTYEVRGKEYRIPHTVSGASEIFTAIKKQRRWSNSTLQAVTGTVGFGLLV